MFMLGWYWGATATDRPRLSLGYLRADAVSVWTTDPGGEVRLWWTTESTGRVEIVVWLQRSSAEPANVVVVLECDARLEQLQFDTYEAEIEVQSLGDDKRGCSAQDLGEPRENLQARNRRPAQVFDMRFSGELGGRGQVWGSPTSPWSDEAAGERVSYTPFIAVGAPETRYSEMLSRQLHPPARASVLTRVRSTATETVESFFPPSMDTLGAGATGDVSAGLSQNSLGAFGPEVTWSSAWSRADEVDTTGARLPSYVHEAATARWSDSGDLARAQLRLLLAGLLMGIAGAVAVEGLFVWSSREQSGLEQREAPR
jgi:hypothetical protein